MYKYCFFQGKIISSEKPLLKVNDISVLRGYAGFDFLRIYNGEPFCFDEHFERFQNTIRSMNLVIPYTKKEVKEILYKLINKNKDKNYQVRFIVTGGETIDGMNPSHPVFYILFEKFLNLPDIVYKKGAKLITNEYLRILPNAKHSNYMNAVLLQKERNKQKAVEILYINNNKVLECSTSNIFIVKAGKIITPKDNILKGITRKNVIDIMTQNKLKFAERDISVKELKSADEVFITATNKKVVPIIKIDEFKIGNNKIGEITKFLMNEYNNLIKN